MSFSVIPGSTLSWVTRPHQPGEPARHVAELSERAGMLHGRANLWRYEPGARGRRHRHPQQEETFVVISGTLTMHLGDPPETHSVTPGGVVHVPAGTALQTVNASPDEDLLVYVHGYPPEDERAELLD